MKKDPVKRFEKILFRIFILLGVIAIAGIILIIKYGKDSTPRVEVREEAEEEYDWTAGLSDSTIWLPDHCDLYDKISDIFFYDADGEEHRISEFEGKPTVVIFWASWCKDCHDQMPYMNEYQAAAEKYGDINFVFINKTDGERETQASAENYIREKQLTGHFFYDIDLKAYNTLGLHNIPTTFFLDEKGIIKAWTPKQISEAGAFDALLQNAMKGSGTVTAGFITERMMDEEGGIHSLYDQNPDQMKQSDVLSESQGAMLEYALLTQDRVLFDQILSYISKVMLNKGLTAWTVSDAGASEVSALIDDLRIYSSLTGAQALWGGYEDAIADYQNRLWKYGIKNDRYVDFYDAENKAHANRFTLCYGDLRTMKELAAADGSFIGAYEKAEEIVLNGQISSAFPLYYSWYNYKKEQYEEDELNAAEAMVTLLHLAETDQLPMNSIQWLKSRMQSDGVKARYDIGGKVVKDYNYDSTAVYALIVMIANELDDDELRGLALKKMEKMHIVDSSLPYNGGFGLEDGTEMTSFDQIMPALAYAYSEQKGK